MNIVSSTITGKVGFSNADTLGLYIVDTRMDGQYFIFDEGFLHLVRYALSTSCLSEFSTSQLEFFLQYIAAVNGEIYHTEATAALDYELVIISLCIDQTNLISCGNATLHTYVACGTDINL